MYTHLSFETLPYPREQQQSAWSSHIRGELFDADIQSFDTGFNARMAGYRLEGLAALTFNVNGHTLQRTPQLVTQSPKDSVFISIVLAGQMTYYRPDQTLTAGAGSAIVYPASVPYLLASQTGTKQLFLDITPEVARSEFGVEQFNDPYMASFPELTRGHMSITTLRETAEAVDLGHRSDIHLDAMIFAIANNALDLRRDGDELAVMRQIREAVRLLARDTETDSNTLAEAVGYSVRHANRILARHQTSLAQLLAADRITQTLSLLRSTSLPLTEVALRSGFGSVSTMQRQLHKEGLGSASSLRS